MRHETLICAEDVTPDRLSALRDEALPTGEAERLRAHITGCPACRARLADFDVIAGALRAQRELDPGDRILDGAHARLARRPRPARGGRGGRRVWAGLATLAPVAALILLFVYVFAGARHPIASVTPTAQTASGSNTPVTQGPNGPTPTPAPFHTPAYTPAVSAESAWGGLIPAKSITFTLHGATQFISYANSPDFSEIAGIIFTNSPTGPDAYRAQLAYYTVATGVITPLNVTWGGSAYNPNGYVSSIDSHYILYSVYNVSSSTCKNCFPALWSFDRQTGQAWRVAPANYTGTISGFESNDYAAIQDNFEQIWLANLATHAVTKLVSLGATSPSTRGASLDSFQWPYLFYNVYNGPTTTTTQLESFDILNVKTGVTTVINAQVPDPNGYTSSGSTILQPASVFLVGDALYATTDTYKMTPDGGIDKLIYASLYRMDHVFSSGSQFTTLARWPESVRYPGDWRAPNARVIPLGSGYFWDLTEQRLVKTSLGWTRAAGQYLGATPVPKPVEPHGGQPMDTYTITLYDTSTFAIQ